MGGGTCAVWLCGSLQGFLQGKQFGALARVRLCRVLSRMQNGWTALDHRRLPSPNQPAADWRVPPRRRLPVLPRRVRVLAAPQPLPHAGARRSAALVCLWRLAFGWRASLPWQLQLPRHAGRHLRAWVPCCCPVLSRSHPACLPVPRRCAPTAPAAAAASASLPTLSMSCGGQRTTRPCSTSSCTPAWWQVRPRGLFGCRLSCCGLCCCVVGQDGTLHDFLEARKQPWKQ